MRKIIQLLVCLIICCGPKLAAAQGCRLDYTASYNQYVTTSADSNNKIYSTVLVDGDTVGNPSAGCNYPSATHTAEAYNKLSTVGGWQSQTPGCMTCYLTKENDQNIQATPGVTY